MAGEALDKYRSKRDFARTPEPADGDGAEGEGYRWVVQQHAARRLHYDFRLEVGGALASWAVPKGPSYDPAVKRLAVKVEDHPLGYRDFEGAIPRGNYGAGAVIVWDEGTFHNLTNQDGRVVPLPVAVAQGHVSVWLEGTKLNGGWSLTRFRPGADAWALVKRNDQRADPTTDITAEAPLSVKSGLTVTQMAESAPAGAPVQEGRAEDLGTAPLAAARFREPMLAQLSSLSELGLGQGPEGEEARWSFEPKMDGLRCIAVRNGATVELCSRNGLSFNTRFPAIAAALAALPVTNFVLDGEIVGLVEGCPDFGALQRGMADSVEYHVFDLPWLLGQDVTYLAVQDRKSLLAQTVTEGPLLSLVPVLPGDPADLLADACAQGWEGLVAKRAGSPYREGRSTDWRKLKCGYRQELVVGGYTEPRQSRTALGALLLGYWQEGSLRYAGKVGTGFTQRDLIDLYGRLSELDRATSPFEAMVGEKGAHWAEPVLVAEVSFTNWTSDGRLRHPSFLGLRPDKDARQVIREEYGRQPR